MTHPQARGGDKLTDKYPLLRRLRLPQLHFSCALVHRLKRRQNYTNVIYEKLGITDACGLQVADGPK